MNTFWRVFSTREKAYDRYLSTCSQLKRLSGAVLVAQGKQILFCRAYGMASYELDRPNTQQTIFQLGSLSKPFTALAILQSQQTGHLQVTDSVASYLPEYPHAKELTLHHLLTNTSGIPDYILTPGFGDMAGRQTTVDEIIACFHDLPLDFPAGTSFSYSNSNWVLLGAILERVSGLSYGAFLCKHQFEPLGMSRSGYEEQPSLIRGRAAGYLLRDREVIRAQYDDPTALYAAGGLHSTVTDVLTWFRTLVHGDILSEEGKREMFTAHTSGQDGAYGYGMVIDQEGKHPSFHHSGGMHGYQTIAKYYPKDDVTIIVLNNLENAALNQIEKDLAAITFSEPYTLPEERSFTDLDQVWVAHLTGDYQLSFMGRKFVATFSQTDGKFWMSVPPLPRTQVFALSATRYFARSKGEVELSFVPDKNKDVNTIEMIWAGQPVRATRLREPAISKQRA